MCTDCLGAGRVPEDISHLLTAAKREYCSQGARGAGQCCRGREALAGMCWVGAAAGTESSKPPQVSSNRAKGICPCSSPCAIPIIPPSWLQGHFAILFPSLWRFFDCFRELFGFFSKLVSWKATLSLFALVQFALGICGNKELWINQKCMKSHNFFR